MREHTISDVLLEVCKKVPSDNRASHIVTYFFYTNLDHVYIVKVESGNYLYVTIRSDCVSRHCGTNNPKLAGGEFVHYYCTLSVPMAIFLWCDYVAAGSWFLSSCQKAYETKLFRRKRGTEITTKGCPHCCKEYNENMGSCYYLNALGSSYLIHIRHMRHWYMCLVY